MDPYQTSPTAHPNLPPLRLVNRRTLEHVGACPFCGGDHRSDRFHVWMEPNKERFWCRACNAKGPLRKLLGENRPLSRPALRRARGHSAVAAPAPADTPHYRALYAAVALWAYANLRDEANPEPLAYLHQRGIDDASVGRAVLGVTRRDPAALADHLRHDYPELLPYAEAAGVLRRDQSGVLGAHPNLCGALVFPYIAGSEIADLRTRTFPGKGYRSLAGGYTERGATVMFGADQLGEADTVLITEGEIKALIASQEYHAGRLSAPALAHPGLSYLRAEWGTELRARGVRTVILAYDSQPRPVSDGCLQLAPEEIWSIRHGKTLHAAGLDVRVLRLPLAPGETKADLDEFILQHSPARLQHLMDIAPSLDTYHRSLPGHLLSAAKLPPASSYPTRRARPQRLETPANRPATPPPGISIEAARTQIAALAEQHATGGQGILVLAHPPGAGKGHNATQGLMSYLQRAPTPGQIVWTALRKEQIHDQTGLALIPLHGRNPGNCQTFGAAQALAERGYSVRQTLCQRRCLHLAHCAYLRQFAQDADFFAPQPLLQATGWWQDAAVVVLDEFDPGRLTRIIDLTSADLARMAGRNASPQARTLLRWLATLIGTTADRAITGSLLLAELAALARADGIDLGATIHAAVAALPPEEDAALLPGLPPRASVADYEALPLNHLHTILTQLDREHRRDQAGQLLTSRLELSGGRMWLYLRVEHLIAQLARPEQPKLLLDATVNTDLLRAIFPATPIHIERPPITGGARIVQVITRDWAKSTLRGNRRTAWLAEVIRHIRPGRPTLAVCTKACAADLRAALDASGHPEVAVAHYGALRGSNAYRGYDVILTQVYLPNLDAVVQEGRALFADDPDPLDERMTTTDRTLTDAHGRGWVVQVPTFADARLAALLTQRREAELVQAALRGRPFDHPEVQITLLFGLPLPSLPPTEVHEDAAPTPTSNAGRTLAAREVLTNATQELLRGGARVISVEELTEATRQSVVTVRRHMAAVAGRLRLRLVTQRRVVVLPTGGQRSYERLVLMRRGRAVPHQQPTPPTTHPPPTDISTEGGTDHARNIQPSTRVIRRSRRIHPPLAHRRGSGRERRIAGSPRWLQGRRQ